MSASFAFDAPDVNQLVADEAITSVYQPVVELDTCRVVGYEALARGPSGHPLERPDDLFEAAREAGCLSELDEACRRAAMTGALAAGLLDPWTLFVNVEPEASNQALREPGCDWLSPQAARGRTPQVIVELTERALTADPVELLRFVARARERGWGIALDDVGAVRDSLALLPLLRPDVIKLDLRLVQGRPTADVAQIFSAVNAEAERSGAVVLAEGIETIEQLDVARSLGASLGQGWLLGHPAPLPTHLPLSDTPITIAAQRTDVDASTPFTMASAAARVRLGRKALLIEVSKHLEREALRSGETVVVLSALQRADFFTPSTKSRYAELAQVAAFVGLLGEGVPDVPLSGVRGGALPADDPLIGEWDIAVLGPHFAATLVARDLGDGGSDRDRRFEFVLSHDRELTIRVATSLISRICPDRA